MQVAASAAADAPQILGKRDLAQHLRWSRPTLDRRLLRDPDFPVRKRGSQTGGWEFDVAQVDAYLAGAPTAPAADDEPPELPLQAAPPAPRGEHRGEATARQRKDAADAAWKEDRLRRQRGDLVEASAMRDAVGTAFAGLAVKLKAMPEVLVRRLKLPEQAGPVIREEIDRLQRQLVADLREMLAADDADG